MFELVFFTSSRIKLEHAKYLCRDYAIKITGFREKTFGANYDEPRIYDRDQLIALSYQDALQRWNKATSGKGFFIIEDTSVIIDAFSKEKEIPGLDIKYWMQETDFASLDRQLKALGNNRKVTVRSDLILHLPSYLESKEDKSYLQFTSFIEGTVVEKEHIFETNAFYPWLDNKTFNKWFVPEGDTKPISMLTIEEANKADFRVSSFKAMLEYLERNKKIHVNTNALTQSSFDFNAKIFVVFGPSCAGKTTLAEYLVNHYGYMHIEASDYMYLSFYKKHGVNSNLEIGSFASQALNEKPEIVAEQTLLSFPVINEMPTVITGFRSLTELDWFIRNYSGSYSIEVIYVDADQQLRYQRAVLRKRDGEAGSKDEFLRRDQQQLKMGLEEFKLRYQDKQIINNESKEQYFSNFETKYSESLLRVDLSNLKFNKGKTLGQLEQQILKSLAEKWEEKLYYTTTEIAQLINDNGIKPKSKNNVSRYFNQTFHPYYEISLIDSKRRYRLSNTGYSLAKFLMIKNKSNN